MIIFTADTHLTPRVWKSRRDLDGDSFRALNALRDAVLQVKEPAHVILGGDVFDAARIDAATLRAFTEFVDTLFEKDIRVYVIQGNHDKDSAAAFAEIQGAVSLDKTLIELDGRTFYGLNWMPREALIDTLPSVPDCDYLVLHAMFEHLVTFTGACDLSLDDIPTQVGNVLVGDVHINDVTSLRSTGVCISPGPLHPCNIGQQGPHGFYALPAGAEQWEFRTIPTREIMRFRFIDAGEADTIEPAIAAAQQRSTPDLEPIVEIRHSNDLTGLTESWVSKYPGVRFFTKGSATGKLVTAEDILEAQQGFQNLTLIESLDVVVDASKDAELHAFLGSLLVGDAQATIDHKLEEVQCDP
jgi:DNA repair exonuclease SbcCD nuclease subunit